MIFTWQYRRGWSNIQKSILYDIIVSDTDTTILYDIISDTDTDNKLILFCSHLLNNTNATLKTIIKMVVQHPVVSPITSTKTKCIQVVQSYKNSRCGITESKHISVI